MAFALQFDIIDPDGEIKVSHIFWGATEKEARTWMEHHAETCDYFAAALEDDRVIEDLEEIDDEERPVADEEEEEESETEES